MPNELLLGINTLAFTSPFSDQDVELFPRLKQMGYEAIEITFGSREPLTRPWPGLPQVTAG